MFVLHLIVILFGITAAGISNLDAMEVAPQNSRQNKSLENFPTGYIDSPFVVPDGSALYFMHTATPALEFISGKMKKKRSMDPLPGHQGASGHYWWNTDLYVSYALPDGRWGAPQNLGSKVNTVDLEACVWVSDDQKTIIFTRESFINPKNSGNFISLRDHVDNPWPDPQPLPNELGDYKKSLGLHDLHLTLRGNIYAWTENNGGKLYSARKISAHEWEKAQPMPDILDSSKKESQPWVNNEETIMYYNRRGKDGNTDLMRTERSNPSQPWPAPKSVKLIDFADPKGAMIWGEPSFTKDGWMYFLRFNTVDKNWKSELMKATRNPDGSFGPPQLLMFK